LYSIGKFYELQYAFEFVTAHSHSGSGLLLITNDLLFNHKSSLPNQTIKNLEREKIYLTRATE